MRICIISWYPTFYYQNKLKLRELKAQHPYSWITNLSSSLSNNYNIDVHIISFNSEIDYDQTIYDELNKFTVHYLSPPVNITKRYLLNFYFETKKLKKVINKIAPDLIHGQGTAFPCNLINRFKIPYIITIHGISNDFLKVAENFTKKVRLLVNLWLENRTINRAKNIIVISEHVNNFLSSKKKNKYNKYFINNAVSKVFFEQNPNFQSNKFIFIGNDVERKGLFEIVKILEKIDKAELIVISTDQTNFYKSKILPYVNEKKLNSRIIYFNHVENNQIPQLISQCLGLILPSKAETAPIVIAEANAVGIPVIAYNVGGISKMISNNITGFVIEPNDEIELYSKMRFLLENKEIAKRMGKAAKKLAIENYHPDIIAQKTYKCYLNILDNINI
ncbi:MAG: glycosyltransferase family 4 protein [Ignavibacteriales bacterium]|nr:glycosyltransferase family 4 protein [Ignavibacteriales bacterium]